MTGSFFYDNALKFQSVEFAQVNDLRLLNYVIYNRRHLGLVTYTWEIYS